MRNITLNSLLLLALLWQACTSSSQKSDKKEVGELTFRIREASSGNYLLQIGTNTQKNPIDLLAQSSQQRQEWIYFYSYTFEQKLYLVRGKDTLLPEGYHYERSFDLAEHLNINLSFPPDSSPNKQEYLVIDAQELPSGIVKVPVGK